MSGDSTSVSKTCPANRCSCARPTTQKLWEFCLRDFYVYEYDSHANRCSSAKIQDTNILSWKSEYDLEKLTETNVPVSKAHTKSVLCYTVLR